MSNSASAASAKPSSSVKLVLLGEAAVGKVSDWTFFCFLCGRGHSHGCSRTAPVRQLRSPAFRFYQITKLTFLQSSLVLRFVNNDFQENKEPTIGGTSISLPQSTTCLQSATAKGD